MSDLLLEAQDLSVTYGRTARVLRQVNLSLKRGEIVTIIGPNGSGKSTLLRALLGVIAPSSGSVQRARDLRIGYVPQSLHLDANLPLSVARFLRLNRRLSRDEIDVLLARVGASGLEKRAMSQLSGGQFQRVLLAQALAGKPDILVLDEPTQGLDQPGTAGFYRLIEEVRDELNCAVLSVSHDLHVVMSASDRVICLNGHVCCEGAPSVVSNAPEYRALFGLGTQGAFALYQHHHDHGGDDPAHPGHANCTGHDHGA